MLVSHNLLFLLSGVIAMLSFSACNGVFEGIYDNPLAVGKHEFGFITADDKTGIGSIYLDATDYAEWHYIDLLGKKVVTKRVEADVPNRWDFAVHRYDAKTNGGAVMESAAADFGSISGINPNFETDFVADEWTADKITVDMSQMMDGVIRYAEDYYNPCLSRWLHVDTSTMPPVYTLSGKIYLLRLADGSYAALRLSNYMNDAAVKGFMTIDYLYPVQL